ncbi:MAG: biotin/lipoyl-containing protein [Candidatus Syntropharchaeia archaeon]
MAEVLESPMPGTILKVNVKVGDKVKEGDVIAVMEAMKMELDLVAPASGTIKELNITEKQTISKTGEVLAVIE